MSYSKRNNKNIFNTCSDWIFDHFGKYLNDVTTTILAFVGLFCMTLGKFLPSDSPYVPYLYDSFITLLVPILILALASVLRSIGKIDQKLGLWNEQHDNIVLLEPMEHSEEDIIKSAKYELLFVQETGSMISEKCREYLGKFIQEGNTVKMVVVARNKQSQYMLAMRNDDQPLLGITGRSTSFHNEIGRLVTRVIDNEKKLSVRFNPYPYEVTQIIRDPEKKDAECVVRFADYRVPFSEKLAMRLKKAKSDSLFLHYYNQFSQLYLHSYKKIIVTGDSKVGKSQLFEKLVDDFKKLSTENDKKLFYLITRERRNEQDVRCGFEFYCSNSSHPEKFAEKKEDGDYEICKDSPLDEICDHIDTIINSSAESSIEKWRPIIIIDEIGPLQMRNSKFKNVIEKLFLNEELTVFASLALEKNCLGKDEKLFVEKIKKNYMVDVILLEKGSADSVLKQLQEEFEASTFLQAKTTEGE